MSLFTTFDIFSYRFGFQHKGNGEFKTAIGGVVSITIITWIVGAFFIFSGNFLYKKNPRITIKDDLLDKPAGILLSQNTFVLGFQVDGLNSDNLLYNNLFKTEISYYDDSTNIMTTIVDTSFEFVACRSLSGYKFEDLVKNKLELYVNGLCLKFPTGKEYDLKNSLINLGFYCNKSKDDNCLYNQEFKDKMLDRSINIYYLDLNVNIDETKNFFNNKLQSFQMIINPLLSTKAELNYQFTTVESDFGLISESLSEKTDISANNYSLNNIFNNKLNLAQKDFRDTIKLFNLDVLFGNKRNIFKRFYYKLQNLFADLGGIINISLIFGKILLYFYNKRSFELDILNDLFSVEDVNILNNLNINNDLNNKTENLDIKKEHPKEINSAKIISKKNFYLK